MNATGPGPEKKASELREEDHEALNHPKDFPEIAGDSLVLNHPHDLPPQEPDELEELEESPADLKVPARQNKESPFQYCFRLILHAPGSRDGIYLTRILLSLSDGERWPYPLSPALQQLTPHAKKLATEMVIIYLSAGAQVREHYFARALGDDEDFADYAEECRPIRSWLDALGEEVEKRIELNDEAEENSADGAYGSDPGKKK